jgi:flagellar motor switch protein FliN/FliY
MRLGVSTAEAIAQALETLAPGQIERGEVTVVTDGTPPFVGVQFPAVAASVSYVDGVTGANAFVMSAGSARALATAMGAGGDDEAEITHPAELSELELSAIAEAANQMMAAAASAISLVLGQEVEISPPQAKVFETPKQAEELYGKAPYATGTTFMIARNPCRLVQLIPRTFVARMARAFDQLGEQAQVAQGDIAGDRPELREAGLTETLSEIKLRVWAEIGRTRLPLGRTLEIPAGAVIELDRAADDPVDLYVNGLLFGRGALLTTETGEWAIRLLSVQNSQTKKGAAL